MCGRRMRKIAKKNGNGNNNMNQKNELLMIENTDTHIKNHTKNVISIHLK